MSSNDYDGDGMAPGQGIGDGASVAGERPMDLFHDRRRLVTGLVALILLVVAIYLIFPKLVGLDDAFVRLGDAVWYWLIVAAAFSVASFVAYGALFRGILRGARDEELWRRLDVRATYRITMAGLAASRIFSAGGAGGIALTYWALRKAGLERRRAACRMTAFLAVMYLVYLLALVIFGVLLRTGVLPGESPAGGTIVPAAAAALVLLVIGLIALIPGDVERRLDSLSRRPRRLSHVAARLATGPAIIATGIRTAIDYVRRPRRGALALAGALGFWAANIGILWASFEAFSGDVPFGVLVQGFFFGMIANLLPSPAGGVGAVDAGMIASFLLFGVDASIVFPAILAYRVMAFWLPIPPGIVAYLQLRHTVADWENEPDGYTLQTEVKAAEPA